MGNRGTKERRRQMEQEARLAREAIEWERARTEPLSVSTPIYPPDRGFRRLQLVVADSFEQSSAWELRHGPEWLLYHSHVVSGQAEILLTGYDRVVMSSDLLGSYFARVTKVNLPLVPDLSSSGGLDGTNYELAVFGDLSSQWRVQWWSTAPPHWKPLVELALEMDAAFTRAWTSGTT